MHWQIIVFSRVITNHILQPILLKRITGLPSMKRRFCWQFLFCLIFSVIYAAATDFSFSTVLLAVAGIGFFNSLAAYSQWQAIKISLSKTSLFTQGDDFIAMLLGYWILNEIRYLNIGLVIGIILCFLAAALLMSKESNIRLIKLVLIYSIIWGVAMFLERYFAVSGVSFSEFLVSWYGGTFIGSLCILFFSKEEEMSIRLTIKEIKSVGILAITVWISMLLGYWAAWLAPITVYQPIYLVTEAVFPSIIGFFIFKELKSLSKREKLAFLTGLTGILFISLSYY